MLTLQFDNKETVASFEAMKSNQYALARREDCDMVVYKRNSDQYIAIFSDGSIGPRHAEEMRQDGISMVRLLDLEAIHFKEKG